MCVFAHWKIFFSHGVSLRILLTNDDGVHAPGLWYAADALKNLGEVIVAAPDREQSGIGTAVSLHHPIRVTEIAPHIPGILTYAVEGTPSDAVILAQEKLLEGGVDIVVSGINQGANLGRDVLISGTVAAALQAYFRGTNAIAISVAALTEVPYEPAARLLQTLVASLLESSLRRPFLLNVNLPKKPLDEIEGIVVTSMADLVYEDQVTEADDARRPYYWISRSRPNTEFDEGTDLAAIRSNQISITPLQIGFSKDNYDSKIHAIATDLLGIMKSEEIQALQGASDVSPLTESSSWVERLKRQVRPIRTAMPRVLCDDLEPTVSFYQSLGFSVDQEYKNKEEKLVEVTLRKGGAVVRYSLMHSSSRNASPTSVTSGVEIYFVVLNLDRLYEEIKGLGIVVEQEIESTDSGGKEFVILDPNGHRLVFAQPKFVG
jgi:5'-nucleotidase